MQRRHLYGLIYPNFVVFSAYSAEYQKGIPDIYEVAKSRLTKTQFWPVLQKNQKASLLLWIGTEASHFQVKLHSRVILTIGNFDIIATLSWF